MNPLLDYWLKVNLFLLLFFGCYWLMLRRHTFLTLNRTYLLGSVGLALVLPLVHVPGLAFPWPWETDEPVYAVAMADAITVVGNVPDDAEAPLLPDWPVLAQWGFALVAAGLLLRTAWRTGTLLRQIQRWPGQSFADHTLVLPNNDRLPTFSFFRYLVLNPADAQADAVRQHELVHIRQRHSLDVLLLEVVHALCWPNPVLFGYRRVIRQVHEYLADRDAVVQTPDHRDAYARFLVSYAFHLPEHGLTADALAHAFGPDRPDSPTLKQRIQMLYQQHTRRRALWKYALVLPLATALLAMTTEPEPTPVSDAAGLLVTTDVPATDAYLVSVSGWVNDNAGKPLPGAEIIIKGSRTGTTTDAAGKFNINAPANSVLVVNFIGFEAQQVTVMDKSAMSVNIVLATQGKGKSSATTAATVLSNTQQVPAKSTTPRTLQGGEVFTVVDQHPMFSGGMKKLYAFVNKNLRYPAAARRAKVSGKVFVSFIVNATGRIEQPEILKGIGFACDEEAIRLVKSMPNWIPGKQNGRTVAVKYNLPISFQLVGGKKAVATPGIEPNQQESRLEIETNEVLNYDGKTDKVTYSSPTKISLINGTEQPLYLLDGKEVAASSISPDKLDPTSIQIINVLKDAAALSQYGEKGRNGVVIITTKAGAQKR